MYIAFGFLGFFILLIIVYLICIAPQRKNKQSFLPFEERYIAHRGLFDNSSCNPENSLRAFRKAIEGKYGIELDVQITKDGQLVVFHDDSLKRMCGEDLLLEDCTYEQLQKYYLGRSKERIPLLAEVLDVVDGKVPLIVEIKNSSKWKQTTILTAAILDGYKGCYCVESFNPFVVAWFRKNRSNVIRGQLSTNFFKDDPKMSFIRKFILTNLLLNGKARPHFIAYNHKYKNQFSYRIIRKLFTVKNVAWTIRSQKELEEAKDIFSCMIFDNFTPNEQQKRVDNN